MTLVLLPARCFYTGEGEADDDLDALICMLDAEAGFFSSLEGELPAMSENESNGT